MSLDARIKKLAKGRSARRTADDFLRSDAGPPSVSAEDRDRSGEFEATVEAMFLMAAVDGDISAPELAQLAASLDAFTELEGKAHIDAGPLLVEMNERLARDGWNQRLHAIADRLRDAEARTFAFRLAAGVAFVDDVVAHAEAAALEAMASALSIGADESQEILYDVREALFD